MALTPNDLFPQGPDEKSIRQPTGCSMMEWKEPHYTMLRI